jgi:hypothetical protein
MGGLLGPSVGAALCFARLPAAMSALAIVLICVVAVAIALFAGGLLAARRRAARQTAEFERNVAAADNALEQARAADRGWDREVMEQAARRALEQQRPAFEVEELHLVLVDDRPGKEEDRAHFVARGGGDEARVLLARTGDHWGAERVE